MAEYYTATVRIRRQEESDEAGNEIANMLEISGLVQMALCEVFDPKDIVIHVRRGDRTEEDRKKFIAMGTQTGRIGSNMANAVIRNRTRDIK
jgi:hypothetical protein